MPELNQPKKTFGQIIKEMPAGRFTTLTKISPAGSLQARKDTTGNVGLFWRYSIGQKSERIAIGSYDPSAPPRSLLPTDCGFSLSAAVRAAEKMAQVHESNLSAGGFAAVKSAEAHAKAQQQIAAEEAELYTVRKLLTAYADHLENLGRASHGDVRSIFKLHVFEAWPKHAQKPANQLTSEQVADMMRRVVELGKGRTANKLRSYLRAAYQTAKAARTKASIPLSFKSFSVVSNPAADTEPDERANRTDKHPLSLQELRTYWNTIKQMPGIEGACLRLHLLTGGQRIRQLTCVLNKDVGEDQIVLFDGKGRSGQPPRPHAVPLTAEAKAALKDCQAPGKFALSTDGGVTHIAATTLSAWAADAAHMLPGFKTKRVRSGIETVLAASRIEEKIRGRLQSHGVSGVQARHYDGHDYVDEKRHALETLFAVLEGADPKVINRQLAAVLLQAETRPAPQ